MPSSLNGRSVLLIEDNPDHAELIKRQLSLSARIKMDVCWRKSLDEGLRELELRDIGLILLDLRLPDSDFPSTVERTASAAPAIPIVVLTSLDDTESGVKAVADGAQDYLVKTQITADILLRSMRYAIERKRIRLEMDRYAQELERSNRELEQFARIVSHDLKSPLAVIQMDLMMLGSRLGKIPTEAAEFLESAGNQAQKMSAFIDDLLQFARIQQTPQEFHRVDCQTVFNDALELLEADIAKAGAEITHDLLPTVNGHATLLTQLFQNLLCNAINYRSAAPPAIHVSAELLDHEWVFSVTDNGMGVAAEDRQRIFSMFERAHAEVCEGTGIGLATCKRIVERHGGRIWMLPASGGGSVFYFTLPLAEAATRVHAGLAED